MPGTSVAGGTLVTETRLGYSCTSASGEHEADVTVSVELPLTSPVDTAVRPEQVQLGLTLAPELLGELPEGAAPKLSGVARLETAVTQNGVTTGMSWEELEIAESPVTPDQGAAVEATGAVPTVTARSSGAMVFAAGKLHLDLVLRAEEKEQTDPAVASISCVVDADQSAELGTVEVPGAPVGSVTGTPDPGSDRAVSPQIAPRSPDPKEQAASEVEVPDLPGCTVFYGPVALPAVGAHGYMAGYANVNKQKAALKFSDPAHLRLQLNSMLAAFSCPDGGLTWIHSEGTMDYKGKPQMPPARSTFLTFGFMPTTATVEMSLTGPINIETIYKSAPDPVTHRIPETTTSTAHVNIRLYDVKVNGTPLDVGPDCRAVRPMTLVLTGKGSTGAGPAEGYTVKFGGALTGNSDVPPFSGCGVTEDLDKIFTASVSGNGNFTKMMQSPLCVDNVPANCPDPPRPKPER
ncbi:DUF6801 domain-containing protein [Streptomyces sp. NPDC002932]|uniref:DUF6801 domain-containing protein n=1 Tax=Streptomyces sp. NPDC002932 TaxID=3364672 RepID=UPI0036753341